MIPGGEVHPPTPKVSLLKTVIAKSKVSTDSKLVNNSSGLLNPLLGAIKTQGIHGYNGVDLGAPVGTPVRASASGEVIVAKGQGWNGGYGDYIVIRHRSGIQTLYAHLSKVNVAVGEQVTAGENIALSGNSGKSTGPHLHFEVRGAKNPF